MPRTQITSADVALNTLTAADLANDSVERPEQRELRPHQQTVANNTVFVEPGTTRKTDGTGSITFAGGSSPAFAVIISGGNSRIDLLLLSDTGVLSIQSGVEAVSPAIPVYPTDKTVIAEVTITETSSVIVVDADIRDVRGFGGGGSGGGGGATPRRYKTIAAGGETIFNLPFSYTVGDGSLVIFRSGTVRATPDDYTETSSTSVTFNTPAVTGEVYQFLVAPAGGTTRFVQSFSSATVVTVTHNLGSFPVVAIIDNTSTVIDAEIVHDSVNQLTVTLSLAATGTVVCVAGTAGRSDVTYAATAATTIATFQVLYQNGVNNQVDLADADSTTTMPAVGIAVSAAAAASSVSVLVVGRIANSAWAWTAGGDIFVSGTAGDLTQTVPSGTGKVVQKVGFALNATTVVFNFTRERVVLS